MAARLLRCTRCRFLFESSRPACPACGADARDPVRERDGKIERRKTTKVPVQPRVPDRTKP